MSDTLDHNGLPEDELLAAELALGVLEGAERTTAEQRAIRTMVSRVWWKSGNNDLPPGRGN